MNDYKLEMENEVVILDNNSETFDRYTCIFINQNVMQEGYEGLVWYVGMSENPYHPQGFGQHGEIQIPVGYSSDEIAIEFAHLGQQIKISELPEKAKQLVIQELDDMSM